MVSRAKPSDRCDTITWRATQIRRQILRHSRARLRKQAARATGKCERRRRSPAGGARYWHSHVAVVVVERAPPPSKLRLLESPTQCYLRASQLAALVSTQRQRRNAFLWLSRATLAKSLAAADGAHLSVLLLISPALVLEIRFENKRRHMHAHTSPMSPALAPKTRNLCASESGERLSHANRGRRPIAAPAFAHQSDFRSSTRPSVCLSVRLCARLSSGRLQPDTDQTEP